jgi:hypothetical protein
VSIIRENFYNIEAIKVWGGEDNIPAYYNTVFVCIKPIYGEYLTETEKKTIKNIISERAIMNMGVTFVNPDYINIKLESTVYFTPSKLKVGSDLGAIVKSALMYYSDTELEAFNKQFRYSNMTSIIDQSDPAVNNNITTVQMYKVIDVEFGKGRSYTVNFINTLDPTSGSVESSSFYSSLSQKAVVLKNLGTAMILGYYDDQSNKFVVLKEMGTIDYKTGSITINTINILSLNGNELRMFARPQTNDMISLQSNILRIKNEDVNIKLVADIPNQLRIQST